MNACNVATCKVVNALFKLLMNLTLSHALSCFCICIVQAYSSLLLTEIQNPSEDRINIYDDDPARGNFSTDEDKAGVKDSSTYHCVGPSASKEDALTGGAKAHQYQEINSFHLGDRYEIHHPEPTGKTDTKIAWPTAYETPIARKVKVSEKYKHYRMNTLLLYFTVGNTQRSCFSQ